MQAVQSVEPIQLRVCNPYPFAVVYTVDAYKGDSGFSIRQAVAWRRANTSARMTRAYHSAVGPAGYTGNLEKPYEDCSEASSLRLHAPSIKEGTLVCKA